MKMELDIKEFTDTLKEYSSYNKRENVLIVKNRAAQLAKQLFKRFKFISPTAAYLRALPESLNYRIKRKQGKTVEQEIRRRINARFTAASGWLCSVKILSKTGVTIRRRNAKGRVIIDLNEPSITIINEMKEAAAAEDKYSIMQQAIDDQVSDMKDYIEEHMEKGAQKYFIT